jgi:hypothetical protein
MDHYLLAAAGVLLIVAGLTLVTRCGAWCKLTHRRHWTRHYGAQFCKYCGRIHYDDETDGRFFKDRCRPPDL